MRAGEMILAGGASSAFHCIHVGPGREDRLLDLGGSRIKIASDIDLLWQVRQYILQQLCCDSFTIAIAGNRSDAATSSNGQF